MKPIKKNCYTGSVKRNKCRKLPKSVGKWFNFVCKNWKPRDLGPVALDCEAADA
jgi:hypothetical protein